MSNPPRSLYDPSYRNQQKQSTNTTTNTTMSSTIGSMNRVTNHFVQPTNTTHRPIISNNSQPSNTFLNTLKPNPSQNNNLSNMNNTQPNTITIGSNTQHRKREIMRLTPGDTQWDRLPRTVLINERQVSNTLLNYIHHVNLCVGQTLADFEFGNNSCALFLSVKFHILHPKYIITRFEQLTNLFVGKYLLIYMDTDQTQQALLELHTLAHKYNWTVICSWDHIESARYIEAFRILHETMENESSTVTLDSSKNGNRAHTRHKGNTVNILRGKQSQDNSMKSVLSRIFQIVKSLNKSDITTLQNEFTSFDQIVRARKEELASCPGFGPNKVARLHKIFRQPLSTHNKFTESEIGIGTQVGVGESEMNDSYTQPVTINSFNSNRTSTIPVFGQKIKRNFEDIVNTTMEHSLQYGKTTSSDTFDDFTAKRHKHI